MAWLLVCDLRVIFIVVAGLIDYCVVFYCCCASYLWIYHSWRRQVQCYLMWCDLYLYGHNIARYSWLYLLLVTMLTLIVTTMHFVDSFWFKKIGGNLWAFQVLNTFLNALLIQFTIAAAATDATVSYLFNASTRPPQRVFFSFMTEHNLITTTHRAYIQKKICRHINPTLNPSSYDR